MEEYPIYFAQEQIGMAKVIREGLYYRICCRCSISGSIPFRVKVTGTGEADLGLCVPMGESFGMEARIPVKRVGNGELKFQAVPKRSVTEELTVISPEEPFGYIARLKDAYLVKRGQATGICFRITERSPDLQDSGQNP